MRLNTRIDHTLLKPDATPDQIRQLCREAVEHGFASVCVNPCYVSLCAAELTGSNVLVCTVIGFPLGASTTTAKVFETKDAIWNGAREVDMVMAVGQLKAGNAEYVRADIQAVVAAAGVSGVPVKVIMETHLLTDQEKRLACQLAVEAGAAFVKTSTGFTGGGAMVEAGADRLGTSSGVKISMEEHQAA